MPPPKDPMGRERWLQAHRKNKTPNCVCLKCGKVFYTYPSKLKSGSGKYCSRECAYSSEEWKQNIGKGNAEPPNRVCKMCGTTFRRSQATIDNGGGIYCSRGCQFKDPDFRSKLGLHNKGHKTLNCACHLCGKLLYRPPIQIAEGGGIYCSPECRNSDPAHISKVKGKVHKPHTEESKRARSKRMTGLRVKEKNPNWKGGMRQLRKWIQDSPRYWEWRKAVFERDDYKDYFSGCTGDIVAHHIIPFSVILERNNIKTIDEAMNCKELFDVNNGVTMLKTSHMAFHDIYGQTYKELEYAQINNGGYICQI